MTISKTVFIPPLWQLSSLSDYFTIETKDERVFLLDESLHFRSTFVGGTVVLAWRDFSGDRGDVYKFICDSNTQPGVSHAFELVGMLIFYYLKL
jgi:VID27 N-terminal region